jgi:periplasmic protein TonB
MKLDNFKQNWLDIVFEGKNKKYGAYELRQETSKTTSIGLVIGCIAFVGILATVFYLSNRKDSEAFDETKVKLTKLDIPKAPPPPPPKTPPPPPPPPKPKVDQVKFVKPKPVKKEEAEEDPPKQQQMEKEKPAATTQKGSEDGSDKQLEVKRDAEVTKAPEVDPNQIFTNVEVSAAFPGGPAAFGKYVAQNFKAPDEMETALKVYVQFVVERDGSLTDIKVTRDPGYGAGAEAIRVLKRCPKWKPGIQNGQSVRQLYNLPITINPGE